MEAVPGIIESYLRPFQACDSTNNLICNEAMDENIFFGVHMYKHEYECLGTYKYNENWDWSWVGNEISFSVGVKDLFILRINHSAM